MGGNHPAFTAHRVWYGTVGGMRTATGDLWDLVSGDPGSWAVVTTNGCLRADGTLVMGAGIAQQAAARFPQLPAELGRAVAARGNVPAAVLDARMLSWPTKPAAHELDGRRHAGWMCAARVRRPECVREVAGLVWRNAPLLVALADDLGITSRIYCPPPGCGLGGLNWSDVGPHVARVLDDRFTIVQRAG